ncbi:hypothetical protein C6501_13520 [Candidatus Poribacteria bacterium]|nr:MAG: hypothetical protein C6501_13520 [Candidatus Poribacteria bacterium]
MRTNWIYCNIKSFHLGLTLPLKTEKTRKTHLSYLNFGMIALLCFGFFVIAGCGYVSTSSYLEHIRTIRIEPIEIDDPDFTYDNVSQRPYDEVVREKLIQRFNRKWSDGNDAKFTLRIQNYDIKEHGFGPSGNVELLRMSLQIEYEFVDNVRNNMIAKTDNHVQIHDFYVVENRGEPRETVDQAKTLIIDELIEDLYNQLAEQW